MQKIINKIKNLKTKIQQSKLARGFTLIETLIAITILLLAITAPLQIASQALFSAFYAREQITAYYLAAEVIEYIKNSRDTTFLNDVLNNQANTNWLQGLDKCISITHDSSFKGCYIETTYDFYSNNDEAIKLCDLNSDSAINTCPYLKFDSSTGLWGYTAGNLTTAENSKFRRKIVITPQGNVGGNCPSGSDGSNCDEALITVTVSWEGQSYTGSTHSYVLTGSMINWERK